NLVGIDILEPPDAGREPVGQRVEVPALGEEHQDAEIDIQRRDGDDDALDLEDIDADGIEEAAENADAAGDYKNRQPVAAVLERHRHGAAWGHRRGRGERDVDAAGAA